MWFKVAKASELLVITGAGIEDIKIAKKGFIYPGQSCTVFDLSPVNYTFNVNTMSNEKLPFLLPAVFTIGPKADDDKSLLKYAKLLSSQGRQSHDVKDLVQGIIEGETRVIVAHMTMEQVFNSAKDFKKEVFEKVQVELDQFGLWVYNANIKELVDVHGHEYFSYLGQKVQTEAANQAKVDVAEAKMKGDIGAKERHGLTIQNAAKIDSETKIEAIRRQGEASKEEIKVRAEVKIFENERDADVAEANAELSKRKSEWGQQANLAEVEGQKVVLLREAQLQKEVEEKNSLAQTERLRGVHLSKASVEYEVKVLEANWELYKKQKEAEALLYATQKASEAQKISADANLYSQKRAADAALYTKRLEAEGLIAMAEAHGTFISILLKALGGNYGALRDYLLITRGIFQELARINAEAVRGMRPNISVWTSGGDCDGGGDGGAAMKVIASVYDMLPPLFKTVEEQTALVQPVWCHVDEYRLRDPVPC